MDPFKDNVAYTPKMLASTHGLDERKWDNIIRRQLPQMGLPNLALGPKAGNKWQRVAAFGCDLNRWYAQCRLKAAETAKETDPPRQKQGRKRKQAGMAGVNPDGTLMNSRQLKAAGLWEDPERSKKHDKV